MIQGVRRRMGGPALPGWAPSASASLGQAGALARAWVVAMNETCRERQRAAISSASREVRRRWPSPASTTGRGTYDQRIDRPLPAPVEERGHAHRRVPLIAVIRTGPVSGSASPPPGRGPALVCDLLVRTRDPAFPPLAQETPRVLAAPLSLSSPSVAAPVATARLPAPASGRTPGPGSARGLGALSRTGRARHFGRDEERGRGTRSRGRSQPRRPQREGAHAQERSEGRHRRR
ncbi:hypothetical protein SAMN04490356_8545 [Streptomyces melanosporofaciens]|uniref:Uncharacterized protein n=1 Tax=Streptomyces melanosporofaciens TaxID=67327 RepID=A0A1H5AV53_STRMJ|nr:hypothetical protein SAMN04490356_8545 [Streptomyces melanosporofaciens]